MLEDLLVCILAEGHVLIEDLPGVGKTTLARAFARVTDLGFQRVQCTADLLPADVVGTNVFNQREDRFEFRPGPIFANVVLVDEVNRASPKTQSGLLECMQERRVTVDVHSHELARPFVVLATQNPVEFEGTYPLPEAQVDRFMARLSLGYPTPAAEVDMLRAHEAGDRVEKMEPVADRRRRAGGDRHRHARLASDRLRAYVVALLHRTREDARTELGASPRAGLMLLRAAKARALLQGRDHALPDDVQALAPRRARPPHRPRARGAGRDARAGRRRRAGRDAGAVGRRCAMEETAARSSAPAPSALAAAPRAPGCSTPSRCTSPASRSWPSRCGAARVGARRRARHPRRRARSARGARWRTSPSPVEIRVSSRAAAADRRACSTRCCRRRRRWPPGGG